MQYVLCYYTDQLPLLPPPSPTYRRNFTPFVPTAGALFPATAAAEFLHCEPTEEVPERAAHSPAPLTPTCESALAYSEDHPPHSHTAMEVSCMVVHECICMWKSNPMLPTVGIE